MPSRKVDLDSWKSDLLGAGVNVESHEVSEKGRKLTVFLLFRLFHVCSSTAHFRETLLRFLGHDPKLMPPNVMPVDKLRKGTNKIVGERVLKKGSRNPGEFEAFESSEIDLKRIGFVSECLNPPAMPRLLPNIDCFEPMPKISRASTEKGPPSPAELEKALRNVNQKLEYWQGKCRSAELKSVEFESLQKSNEELHLKLSHANSTIEKLKIQLAQLERDIEMHSKATVPSVQPDHKQFNLKNRKGYTAKALTLFGQLSIDFQVAEAKVGRVLETVANFFGITLDSLPSARTVGRAMYIISAIAAEQISEIVEQKGVEFTLMSDETTKKFNKLQAFVVTYLNEQTQQLERLYLDVEAVSNKSSPRQLEAFQTAFEDIAARAQKCKSTFFDKFIVKVKNFMGDHAATQVKFAQLCTEYREMIIRDVYPDFEHLSEEEQSLILTTNVIFCFLHLTSNTTPKVLQVLKDDEAKQTGKTGGKKSTVEAFLVEMGRYFGSRTAARYSSVGKWRLYSERKGLSFGKIDSFSKSRFHMVFIIAVQVLYNRDHLIAFVTDHFDDGDIRDFLLTSLQNDLIISHLMVMAAIEINILGPLWRLAERSPNPVDSHLWINAIVDFFDKIKANPMLLFTDSSPLNKFEGAKSKKLASIAHRAMMEGLSPPAGCSILSVTVIEALEDYFRTQFEDQLSDTFRKSGAKLQGVPLTNVPCESVFSTIDWTYRRAPNMNTCKRVTHAVATKNRLFQYVQSKTEEEQDALFEKVLSHRPVVEKLEKHKKAKLTAELIKLMEEEELKKARNRKKNEDKKQKLLEDLETVGIWTNVLQLQNAISKLKPTKALEAVKNNIRYRKLVNKGKVCEEKLFRFQVSGYKLSIDDLISNLSQLITMDTPDGDSDNTDDTDVDSSSDMEDEDE